MGLYSKEFNIKSATTWNLIKSKFELPQEFLVIHKK